MRDHGAGARDDPHVDPRLLAKWQVQTSGPFALHLLDGNHFYLRSQAGRIQTLISATLEQVA